MANNQELLVQTYVVTYRWVAGDSSNATLRQCLNRVITSIADQPLGIKEIDIIGADTMDDKRIILYIAHNCELSAAEVQNCLDGIEEIKVVSVLKSQF